MRTRAFTIMMKFISNLKINNNNNINQMVSEIHISIATKRSILICLAISKKKRSKQAIMPTQIITSIKIKTTIITATIIKMRMK